MQTLKIDPLYLKTTPQAQRKSVYRWAISSPPRSPRLCDKHGIPSHRDMFRFHHADAGAAVSAGHDVRTALLCFGADASHGYARARLSVLVRLAEWLAVYIQSVLTLPEDRQRRMRSVAGFSHQFDPGQPARSETPLPDAGEPVHRCRDDDAS
ncbi:hypothetical protein [Cupriavidus sp. YAF13]|uniref:hypothetical protein n=1 Tax=Cupriavidus sp. YAF13 TaxID=3233075 RepID=UPI003F92A593